MTTHAVIATNQSASYDFFAPLSTLFWADICGFSTICFLTDTKAEWESKSARVTLDALKDVGAQVHFIGKLEGYQNAQAAQSSRQHAAALDLPEGDVLITGDVDMLSLDREWFLQHDGNENGFTSWFANAYGELKPVPPFHPTPYIAASVKLWREVMGLEVRGEILTQMQANFDRTLGRYHDSWTAWWTDELYFNSRLKAWDGYPSRVKMISREGCPPHDRIDRGCWPTAFDWSKKYVDTHLIRPGATPENWPRIRPLIEHYIPQRLEWVDAYVQRYREAKYGA